MRQRVLTGLAGLSLLAIGAAAGWFAHPTRGDPNVAAQIRIATIQQHLDEADPGYVLLAGDSNVALIPPSEPVCGRPTVNAGISGASSMAYLNLMSDLTFPQRPSAAVLTIGTNNLKSLNDPQSPDARELFAKDVTEIVSRLRSLTERVVVTAVPPLGREMAESFDGGDVERYSQRLRLLCDLLGCLYVDPYQALRDGSSGFGLPGANRNGVHLAQYRPVLRNLAATLCLVGATPERP